MMLSHWGKLKLALRKLIRSVLKELGLWERGMLNRKGRKDDE
jgi:hypothetical protein